MMKLKVKQSFSWAHDGFRVESYEAGDEIDTDDQDLVDVATREGWAAAPIGRSKAKVNVSESDSASN